MLRRKTRGSNFTRPSLALVPAENADHPSSPAAARGPSAVQIPIQIDLACDRALHEQIGEQIRSAAASCGPVVISPVPASWPSISASPEIRCYWHTNASPVKATSTRQRVRILMSVLRMRCRWYRAQIREAPRRRRVRQSVARRFFFMAKPRDWFIWVESRCSIFSWAGPARSVFRAKRGGDSCCSASPPQARRFPNISIPPASSNSGTPLRSIWARPAA